MLTPLTTCRGATRDISPSLPLDVRTLLLLGAAAAATRSPKSRALFLPSPRHSKVPEIYDGVWRDGGIESSAHYSVR